MDIMKQTDNNHFSSTTVFKVVYEGKIPWMLQCRLKTTFIAMDTLKP